MTEPIPNLNGPKCRVGEEKSMLIKGLRVRPPTGD